MNLSQWVKALLGRKPRKSPQYTHSRRRSPHLSLEALEDRCVPSVVTNTNDSGTGSLRDAIVTSTAAGGIVTFNLTGSNTITLTSGPITIAKNLTITGPGASSLTIDGNAASQVFIINNGETDTISGLTIQHGKTTTTNGGGIFNFGTLTLNSVTITNNTAESGGGIENTGTLTVNACTISSNIANGGSGGGIDNTGFLTVNNGSSITSNTANSGGGVSENTGSTTDTISNTSIAKNTALGAAGGLAIEEGSLTITQTSIDSNTAGTTGGGGVEVDGGTPIITASTISNNKAPLVGGIYVNAASLFLINSTVSGNAATKTTDTTAATAGGLVVTNESTTNGLAVLTQDTFGNNSATSAADAKDLAIFDFGGGGTASVTLGNTILGSTATTNPNALKSGGGTITSKGNNLSFDGTGAATSTDLKGDPLLGILQNNGGPTLTMLPASKSPVINAGNNTLAVDQNGKALTTDQTGGTRILNTTVDIGAVEVGNNLFAFSAATYSFKEGTTATLTVTYTGPGGVTVAYAVTQPSGLAAKYLATANQDYTGTLTGTLTFAPGVTSQTITFTLPNPNLVEENTQFIVTLSQPTSGASLGSPASATVTIVNTDLPTVPNATPTLAVLQKAGIGFGTSTEHYQHFVLSAYTTYLNRTPSTAELGYWVNLMQEYETNHSIGLRQQDIEAGFLDSTEYLSRNGGGANKVWLDSIYQNLLGRAPDSNGEAGWLADLAAGASAQAVAEGFTDSPERLTDRVTATYQTLLGRAPDANGLAF